LYGDEFCQAPHQNPKALVRRNWDVKKRQEKEPKIFGPVILLTPFQFSHRPSEVCRVCCFRIREKAHIQRVGRKETYQKQTPSFKLFSLHVTIVEAVELHPL
jgi:hypothetical protein